MWIYVHVWGMRSLPPYPSFAWSMFKKCHVKMSTSWISISCFFLQPTTTRVLAPIKWCLSSTFCPWSSSFSSSSKMAIKAFKAGTWPLDRKGWSLMNWLISTSFDHLIDWFHWIWDHLNQLETSGKTCLLATALNFQFGALNSSAPAPLQHRGLAQSPMWSNRCRSMQNAAFAFGAIVIDL